MSTGPRNYYIPRLFAFLEELSHNNNREWFKARKDYFDELRALWLADLDRLIAAMTPWWPEMAGQSAATSAYRIYRDTRFSPDKTPYKLYMAATLSPFGRSSEKVHAGCYLQMGVRGNFDNGLYGGVWCPPMPVLRKLRHAIVDNIEEWESIVTDPALTDLFPDWCGDRLKTVPKGWERDHPNAEYLRLKDIGKFHSCDRSFFLDPEWPVRSAEILSRLKPLLDFLNYSIDE